MVIGAGIVAAFFTFLGTATARVIAERVLLFFAIKALLGFLCLVALPIVLNNVIGTYLDESLAFMEGLGSLDAFNGSMSFSGFLGWLLKCFMIPQCLAITVGAIQWHIVLKMIPFSPVK